jgi:hypothetical protein
MCEICDKKFIEQRNEELAKVKLPAASNGYICGFTPGPWHVMVGTFGKRHDPKSTTVYATHEDLIYVARCDGSQMMFHREIDALANARLIAAAPDMLKALEVCKEALRDNLAKYAYKNEQIMLEAYGRADTAITKAVGEQI